MNKILKEFTENNLLNIEARIQDITGESRMYLEEHYETSKGYILNFSSKKSYAANSWDSSRIGIGSYLKTIYMGLEVVVDEAPKENEREWTVSVLIG